MIDKLNIPTYILFLVASSFIFGFLIWRERKKYNIRFEMIFDLIIIYILVSFLTSRIIYIFQNFEVFKKISWSIYPYYFDPGAKRVWFKQMPWAILNFNESNINYSGLLLGGVLIVLIFIYLKKVSRKVIPIFTNALCVSHVIQIIGFFIVSAYIGKVTDLPLGVKYSFDNQARIPLQFIEIAVIGVLIYAFYILQKKGKQSGIFGIYLFVFSWLQIIIDFLKDKSLSTSNEISIFQIIYLVLVFIGIIITIFAYQVKDKDFINVETSVRKTPNEQNATLNKAGFKYRDYKSSYSTYQSSNPSFWARIKRKFFSKRK